MSNWSSDVCCSELFPIGDGWSIEPQGQIIWQRVRLDDRVDPFSTIGYPRFDAFTGRLGFRIEGDTITANRPWQYFGSVDLWHNFSQTVKVQFNDQYMETALGNTSLELRGGVAVRLAPSLPLFGSVGYTASLADEKNSSLSGTAGLRIRW